MARRKKNVSCQAETTLGVIEGRWKLLILRELESDGIIARKIYPEVPPKVEYSLTASGKTLKPIIDGLHEWGLKHLSSDKRS